MSHAGSGDVVAKKPWDEILVSDPEDRRHPKVDREKRLF